MRPRRPEEITAAAIQAERGNNPAQLPSYFRKLVREQMAAPALERLRQTAMGELVFKKPMVVNKAVKMVECEANEGTQRQALVDLLNIAIPRQSGLVDEEGNHRTGVVILPALNSPDTDHGATVEEEITLFESYEHSVEDPSDMLEETVSPLIVARLLAKRRQGPRAGEG